MSLVQVGSGSDISNVYINAAGGDLVINNFNFDCLAQGTYGYMLWDVALNWTAPLQNIVQDIGDQLESLKETVDATASTQTDAMKEIQQQMTRYSRRLSDIAWTLKAIMDIVQRGQGQGVDSQEMRDFREELRRHSDSIHDISRRM